MKKFSFRLKSVLNYRKNLEKQAQRKLYDARTEYLECERSIDQMKTKKRTVALTCSEKERQGIDVSIYNIYVSYLRKMDQDLGDAHIQLKKNESKVQMRIGELKAALIKKKTLEVLEDSQYKTHLQQFERENQNALDELVVIRRGNIT